MKLELSLHASKLRNVAGMFKGTSDPFAVVTKIATTPGAQPEVLGKTEVCKNTLSPDWVTVFEIDYELGSAVQVAVNIFDEVKKSHNKSMGAAVFDIGELLGARGNTKAKQLRMGGTLFATVRKAQGSGLLRIQMKGVNLKNIEGLFGKSDPFYELLRKVDTAGGKTWDNVFRSEVIDNNLNPQWKPATVELRKLCGGDINAPIKVSVFDFETRGGHKSMGSFETTVNGLVAAAQSRQEFVLLQNGKNVGKIMVTSASVEGVSTEREAYDGVSNNPPAFNPLASKNPPAFNPQALTYKPAPIIPLPAPSRDPLANVNFVDYVSGGCELNVVVAIDFTGSNGDPRKPGTLHYLHPENPKMRNDYEKAIAAIVTILSKFDSDQMYPVLGFGAKYGGVVRHCFQCGPTPEVNGVDGVLDVYRKTFSSGLIMSGPTVFTEVIEFAAREAQASAEKARYKGSQSYTILIILTDGAVSDPPRTAEALRRVSQTPLSVVMVGVGNADFSSMRFLDDCFRPGERDIAQFVEFNKHAHSSVALTEQTLEEIPDQLVGYFKGRGIAPLPPIEASDREIRIEPEDDEIDLSLDIREDKVAVKSGGRKWVDDYKASR